ncbi:uncharacterized protein LOC124179062 isoform X1 [Neodiprion fabricii]|uniref:uncharacterized protein LOC124179062 isoform X1 n=1 Tax=Neodiprion fabricii TaxID=2872261 RepID=UPI001ED8EF75|nr:uncharacterized protein LOC124179062 isoform X1 [Neodiprion fabricii]
MEKVQHLWNIVKFLSDYSGTKVTRLQSYYVWRCRQLSSAIELPSKIFGPGEMCSHCGVLWAKVDHRVRLQSGTVSGRSVKKIIRKRALGKETKKLGRYKDTLLKKALKNTGNKAVIRCSICSKNTKLSFAKPGMPKPTVTVDKGKGNDTKVGKKRKKRTKDKSAGLILGGVNACDKTPIAAKAKATTLRKLGSMMSKNLTPCKKSSLHDFIVELS